MGHILWLSIPSCQWGDNLLWSYMINTAPTDNKTPKGRIKCDSHHETKSSLLTILLPSKLTTHRHYSLLQTRSWSYKQSKLISWQLRKNYKINWICLWTISCCQSKREESRVFRAELPRKIYLTYTSVIQVQLPDSRIGKEYVTCCAPVLVEVDKDLLSRSEAYFLDSFTTDIPCTNCLDARLGISQPKHAQLLQVVLMMKNKWELLLPSPSEHHTSLSQHVTLSYFAWWSHASIQCHSSGLADGMDKRAMKEHPCA